MDDPATDGAAEQLRRKAEQAKRNRHRFLVVLSRFREVCEAQEERRARSNPWAFYQVMEN